MARTTAQINQQIITQLQSNPLFASFFTPAPSMASLWGIMVFTVAYCIAVFEQLLDAWQAFMENLINTNYPGSLTWIQNQVLEFQYSVSSPQVAQLINYAVVYPIVNTALQIITACAVVVDATLPGKVTIKVTNNGAVLTSPQLAALNNYLGLLLPPGTNSSVISALADYILIGGNVYYNGAYSSATISASVINTLNAFISSLPFNGIIQISDIIETIRNTPGVEDVQLVQCETRPNAVIPANANRLVESSQVLQRNYQSYSGLLTADTYSGRTFADTLTFIAQ